MTSFLGLVYAATVHFIAAFNRNVTLNAEKNSIGGAIITYKPDPAINKPETIAANNNATNKNKYIFSV